MASGEINPIDNPQAWDVINVGGKDNPGYCEVGEFKRENEWDIKKGKGTKGATMTFVGLPPAKGQIVFYLWLAQHFRDWEAFRKLFKYDPTKKTTSAIDIYHPSLADIDISSVVTEYITNIVHVGKQMYTVTVDLVEYSPPPKASAVSTPGGSKSTGGASIPGTPTDPVADAQQKEIAALLKTASEP